MNSAALIDKSTERAHLLTKYTSLIFVLLICLPALLVKLDTYPVPWFDEGNKMNMARTIVERGLYATYTVDGYIPFDPATTSGPIDTLLVALSFKLLGIGIFQARIPSILFAMIALIGIYTLCVHIYGWKAGLLSVLFMLAMPPIQAINFLLVGRQGISEIVALGLIVLGLYGWFVSWDKKSVR